MQTLPTNKIIRKEISAHANIKDKENVKQNILLTIQHIRNLNIFYQILTCC